MGFYGQVFYEISNAFATIAVKNLQDQIVDLKATGTGGTLTMAPGNEWIDLEGSNYTCFVKHVQSYDGEENVPIIQKSVINQNDAAILQPGDRVDIPTFTIDRAGHISEVSISQFKLPINEVEDKTQQLEEDMRNLETRVNTKMTETQNNINNNIIVD